MANKQNSNSANEFDLNKALAEVGFKDVEEIKNDLGVMEEQLKLWAELHQSIYDHGAVPTKAMNDKLAELEAAYGNRKLHETYDELLQTTNPIKECVLKLQYTTLKVQDKEEEKIMICKVVEKSVDLNPYGLVEYADKKNQKVESTWTHMSQKLNWLMCIRLGQALGDPVWATENLKNVSDSFMMSAIARDIDLTGTVTEDGKKKPDPLSNKQIIATMSNIITTMVGDPVTCKSCDVTYLENAFGKKGKHAQIVTPKTKTFALILRDIAWRNLTKSNYEMLSKQVKIKK